MAAYVTKTRRGFFGWIFLLLFLGFQALMIAMVFVNFSAIDSVVSENAVECSDDLRGSLTKEQCESARNAGAAIGGGFFAVIGWFAWILGTIVLGIPVLLTRGKTVIVEK